METVTVIFQKFYKEILAAIALILVGALLSQGVMPANEQYNPYESRVQAIDSMMNDVLDNPGLLGVVQDELFYTYYPWAERRTDSQKDTFIDYLEACNQVIIEMSNGLEPDTSEMERLYNELL